MSALQWLVVVDMQPGFGHADSPWWTPGYDACAEAIKTMLPAFPDRVLFTRFVPPAEPQGAWRAYYDQWDFALAPEHRWLWELDPRFEGPQVASARFAKWVEAAPHIPREAELVICGVATDCCVMGTALEAVDDGRRVHLVRDACAAGTEALHHSALTVMAGRAPMLTITDVADLPTAPSS
ncbi:cysteine hydrolase family protein [Frigidibacter sp. ROC022]|uniref:cysteine hydrolase family protein n=1 Tax=Frigidibacter sp. ROC022 TaxID=2971796 RepID=UPI00215A6EBC|nr:cysteine hydrolase [Frigidibacter sp. ROC022]MCR8723498.1 cysteine hydrolase [Frigidibacter sp. ROC022]